MYVIESIVWYFFSVETVGRTLEELAGVFEAPVRSIFSLVSDILCADYSAIVPRTPVRLLSRSKLWLSGRVAQLSLWTDHKV